MSVLALAAACERPATNQQSEPIVARIGVPEADISGAEVGLQQVAGILSTEGLVSRGNDGRARPRIAKSWTSSDDGLTWRFVLENNIKFHDGNPAEAATIVTALRTAMANRMRIAMYPGVADIVSIDAPSPTEIEIKLKRRSTFLLEDLDFPITRVKEENGAKTVVATGPYRSVASSPTEITMEPHETYHQGRPAIDRVIIRPAGTLRTAWASLMRQEIDVLYDVSRDAVEFVGSSDIALYSYLRHYVYLIAFNSAKPGFAPTAVRRALNAAVDRDALVRGVLKGQGIAANGPIWPQHWAYDANLHGYVYDPSLAATTLDAAGLKALSRQGSRGTRLTFTCILPEKRLMYERIALEVQKQLYDIGVDMQLQPLTAEEYDKRIRTGDFDAVMIEMLSGPTLSRPYIFWRWGGEKTPFNAFGYRNAAADRWFDAVRTAPGDAEYRVAVAQLQRTMLEDPPALFLAWTERTRAITRRFEVPNEPGRDPISSFWRWTANGKATPTH